jgi:hypothetical protein
MATNGLTIGSGGSGGVFGPSMVIADHRVGNTHFGQPSKSIEDLGQLDTVWDILSDGIKADIPCIGQHGDQTENGENLRVRKSPMAQPGNF